MKSHYHRILYGALVAYQHAVDPAARRMPLVFARHRFHRWLRETATNERCLIALRAVIQQAIEGRGDRVPAGPKMTALIHAHQAFEALTALEMIGLSSAQSNETMSVAKTLNKPSGTPDIDKILEGLI